MHSSKTLLNKQIEQVTDRMTKLENFLATVRYIDRVRGYPTAKEWNAIVRMSRKLETDADQVLFKEAEEEFRYLYLGESQKRIEW